MRILAVITEDFSLYYDLVRILKNEDIPFVSLSLKDSIPPEVGLVLTSEGEAPMIDFPEKLSIPSDADIQAIINEARRRMRGRTSYGRLIIGIDPGSRPGFAVLASGNVLYTVQLGKPEEVTEIVRKVLTLYPAEEVVVRIGHGDPTNRNRIINALEGQPVAIEIVDERSTTKRAEFPDITAAINIAVSSGVSVVPPVTVMPTEGEIKNLQKRSRQRSGGRVTISKQLANKVARGIMSLEEAIDLQSGRKLIDPTREEE